MIPQPSLFLHGYARTGVVQASIGREGLSPGSSCSLADSDHVMNNLAFFAGLAVALALIITAGVVLAWQRWKSATVASLSALAVTLVITVAQILTSRAVGAFQ
jgi:hypothetical protein